MTQIGTVSKIEELLTAMGVEWTKGKMICPKCGEKKLTASTTKNVAKCWGCEQVWYPGKEQTGRVSWASVILADVVTWAQGYLPRSRPCLTYLRRRLTDYLGAAWFIEHHLGARNMGYDVRPAAARAKEIWQAAYDQALMAAKSKKDRADVDDEFERQKGYLERFVEEKLKPLCSDGFWQEALVFILTNAHGQPLSIKIRQYGEEKPGKHVKFIYTLQPLPGRGGVFDFSPYFSGVWQGRVSTLVLEGEFNWLQLQAQAERWG